MWTGPPTQLMRRLVGCAALSPGLAVLIGGLALIRGLVRIRTGLRVAFRLLALALLFHLFLLLQLLLALLKLIVRFSQRCALFRVRLSGLCGHQCYALRKISAPCFSISMVPAPALGVERGAEKVIRRQPFLAAGHRRPPGPCSAIVTTRRVGGLPGRGRRGSRHA